MNAAEALEAARDCYKNDRPLTPQEFQAIRDFQSDPNTDVVVRGGLKELGTAIARQSDARLARQRVADEVARGQEQARKLQEREQAWQAIDPLSAALFRAITETRDPALMALAKHYKATAGGNRGEAPNAFMPELLHPFERARLGLE